MNKNVPRILGICMLLLALAMPSWAQNTKGDKPASTRETRFKKTNKKQKPAKRIRSKGRTTTSLRAYKPRKKSKGGERAGRPTSPIYQSRPSEKPRNTFPQSGLYVNNKSRRPNSEAKTARQAGRRRVNAISATGSTRNVYPQAGRYVNHASRKPRDPGRGKKIKPRSASQSYIRRRSINMWANFPRPKQKKERAYRGDISGRRIRTKNFETKRPDIIVAPRSAPRTQSSQRKNVYPQSGRVQYTPSRPRESNIYPQRGPYVNNRSRTPKKSTAVSNRSTLARLNRLQGGQDPGPGKRRVVRPRSATSAFIRRRSINMWANFPRPKKKGERASTRDIAGKPLRTKNYRTPPRELIPQPDTYRGRKRVGDRAYDGKGRRPLSISGQGKAWQGDIANRRVGGGRNAGKRSWLGQIIPGRKIGSATGKIRAKKGPIPVKGPGKGSMGIGTYKGNIRDRKGFRDQGEEFTGGLKAGRRAKGGGTVSGRRWNNRGQAIPARTPGIGANGLAKYQGNIRGRKGFNNQGEEFSGTIKARRPAKGGGTLSGRLWNNQGRAVAGRTPGIGARGVDRYSGNIRGRKGFNNQGEEYSGSIKARRQVKGGGSVSGKLWNNKNQPVPARTPGVGARGIEKYSGNIRGRKGFNNQGEEYRGSIPASRRRGFNDQGEEFTGGIRARRPVKGGGSISGKLWNNKNQPIPARTPGIGARGIEKYSGNIRGRRGFNNQGEEYTGSIKARKPLKGGGSVSGKLWNNKETPISPKLPPKGAEKIGGYPGKIKLHQLKPGFNNQGEEYTGNIKASKPVKGGGSVSGKHWNNNETAIAVRVPKSEQGGEFRGKMKLRRGYVKNPNAADEALKKQREKTTYLTDGLQVKVKQRPYGRRKGAPEEALPGLRPTKESVKASDFARGMKAYKYVRNESSSRDALKTREPGKAFARASDYQGNIKLKKFELFAKRDLHPDAKFMKTNKNNVAGEKDIFTNFKLWWARLFKKNDNQPGHLKDKGHKPRYDKGEQGMWYD